MAAVFVGCNSNNPQLGEYTLGQHIPIEDTIFFGGKLTFAEIEGSLKVLLEPANMNVDQIRWSPDPTEGYFGFRFFTSNELESLVSHVEKVYGIQLTLIKVDNVKSAWITQDCKFSIPFIPYSNDRIRTAFFISEPSRVKLDQVDFVKRVFQELEN